MNIILFASLLIVSSSLFAQEPTMSLEEVKEERNFNPRKSHWLTSFGFEGMKYQTFNQYTGIKESFSPKKQEYYGGRIGFGGEIYLGAGLITTTKVEGYFLGTFFTQIKNGGAEDEDVKFAFTKNRGQIMGVDASQALGFLFDMKTKNPVMDEWTYLTVEPYIEAGIGYANAYNRTNYNYTLASTDEGYKLRVQDQLLNAKIGIGINFTASSGYFLYLKATQNRYDITDRKAKESIKTAGTWTNTNRDIGDKIDAITVYAIGGGYKF